MAWSGMELWHPGGANRLSRCRGIRPLPSYVRSLSIAKRRDHTLYLFVAPFTQDIGTLFLVTLSNPPFLAAWALVGRPTPSSDATFVSDVHTIVRGGIKISMVRPFL